jgi:predicted nucleic acid-binding protein
MRLYLDTNIFLDATLPGRPYQQEAQLLLNLIASGVVTAYTASFSISTISYFLQKAFKEETTVIIEQILEHIEVVDLKKEDFIAGHALGFADLEDAYQYIAATKESVVLALARLEWTISGRTTITALRHVHRGEQGKLAYLNFEDTRQSKMETIIRLSPSELNAGLLDMIRTLIGDRMNVDVTISLQEHDAAYAAELDKSIEAVERGEGLTSFTMEEFMAYTPGDKQK